MMAVEGDDAFLFGSSQHYSLKRFRFTTIVTPDRFCYKNNNV